MSVADAAITTVILTAGVDINDIPCNEGVVISTTTNIQPEIQYRKHAKSRQSKNISEEFCTLACILILLILIAIPLLYISDVDTFSDHEICVNHKDYSLNINKLFLSGSIMSILVIPLSKYKIYVSYPNNSKKMISLLIHVIMIIFIILLSEKYHYYSVFVIIIAIYGIILFFNEMLMKSNMNISIHAGSNIYHKHPIIYISIVNNVCLMTLSCISICIAVCEVSINNECNENDVLKEIMMRCGIFYMILSSIGMWIVLNMNHKLKYFSKQSLFLYDMAQNDEIHIKQMENGKVTTAMAVFLIYFAIVFVLYFGLWLWALYGPQFAHGSIEDYISNISY